MTLLAILTWVLCISMCAAGILRAFIDGEGEAFIPATLFFILAVIIWATLLTG